MEHNLRVHIPRKYRHLYIYAILVRSIGGHCITTRHVGIILFKTKILCLSFTLTRCRRNRVILGTSFFLWHLTSHLSIYFFLHCRSRSTLKRDAVIVPADAIMELMFPVILNARILLFKCVHKFSAVFSSF